VSHTVDNERVLRILDLPNERLRLVAVAQAHEILLYRSLIELMALAIPRDRLPASERIMLDDVLGRQP
jgi:hypothetical protein